jgi:hypothetical protein
MLLFQFWKRKRETTLCCFHSGFSTKRFIRRKVQVSSSLFSFIYVILQTPLQAEEQIVRKMKKFEIGAFFWAMGPDTMRAFARQVRVERPLKAAFFFSCSLYHLTKMERLIDLHGENVYAVVCPFLHTIIKLFHGIFTTIKTHTHNTVRGALVRGPAGVQARGQALGKGLLLADQEREDQPRARGGQERRQGHGGRRRALQHQRQRLNSFKEIES